MASGIDKHGNPRETPIQTSILENLQWRGVFAWRNQKGVIPIRQGGKIVAVRKSKEEDNTNGMPDIIAIIGGRFIGIEVKTETGTQSKDQIEWQRRCGKAGGIYIVARSWEDVVRAFKAIL